MPFRFAALLVILHRRVPFVVAVDDDDDDDDSVPMTMTVPFALPSKSECARARACVRLSCE